MQRGNHANHHTLKQPLRFKKLIACWSSKSSNTVFWTEGTAEESLLLSPQEILAVSRTVSFRLVLFFCIILYDNHAGFILLLLLSVAQCACLANQAVSKMS